MRIVVTNVLCERQHEGGTLGAEVYRPSVHSAFINFLKHIYRASIYRGSKHCASSLSSRARLSAVRGLNGSVLRVL